MTFDVKSQLYFRTEYGWSDWYEVFTVCRNCSRSTVFVLSLSDIARRGEVERGLLSQSGAAVNNYMKVEGFINLKDIAASAPPDHLPKAIAAAFAEGATCLAAQCFNAAATMFRLCIDLATGPLLPAENDKGLNAGIRRNLGLRLPWLFDNGLLPPELRELSGCVKEDGNDGAHSGTLKKEDAKDLQEFAHAFLQRLFTEPEKLRIAKERRDQRRKSATP
jgi:hypothetical protein